MFLLARSLFSRVRKPTRPVHTIEWVAADAPYNVFRTDFLLGTRIIYPRFSTL